MGGWVVLSAHAVDASNANCSLLCSTAGHSSSFITDLFFLFMSPPTLLNLNVCLCICLLDRRTLLEHHNRLILGFMPRPTLLNFKPTQPNSIWAVCMLSHLPPQSTKLKKAQSISHKSMWLRSVQMWLFLGKSWKFMGLATFLHISQTLFHYFM